MRFNLKQLIAGIMCGVVIISSTVLPIHAESTITSFTADNGMLGGELIVQVPDEMILSLNEDNSKFTNTDEVSAWGITSPNKVLTVSTDKNIKYKNGYDESIEVNADITFGNEGSAEWTASELREGYVSGDYKSYSVISDVNKDDIDFIGTYKSTIYWNISLKDADNNYEEYFKYAYDNGKLCVAGVSDYGLEQLTNVGAGSTLRIELPSTYNNTEVVGFQASADTSGGYKFKDVLDRDDIPDIELVFPSNYTKAYGFWNTGNTSSKRLVGIELNEGLTEINADAFKNCKGLKKVVIPSTVTSVGSSAFSNCESLKTVIFEEGFAGELGGGSFLNTPATILIPSSCTTIFGGAFRGTGTRIVICDNKRSDITLTTSSNYSIENTIFVTKSEDGNGQENYYYSSKTGTLEKCVADEIAVVDDCITAYFRHDIAKDELNTEEGQIYEKIIIEEGVKTIGASAFYNCSAEVTLPSTITSIGDNAFYGCSFDTLTISEGTTYTTKSFNGATINRVVFEDGITKIPAYALYGANVTEPITIPDTVTSIGASAFNTFKGTIAEVDIRKVTSFGNTNTFYGANITKVTVTATQVAGKNVYGAKIDKLYIDNSSTKTLTSNVFSSGSINDVYFSGSEDEWNTFIGSYTTGTQISNATIHYNCEIQ